MTIFFLVNCDDTQEEVYNVTILSVSPNNDSYKIIGSTYDDEGVEWVALYSNVENTFLENKVENHDIVLYNVKNGDFEILNDGYRDVKYFGLYKLIFIKIYEK